MVFRNFILPFVTALFITLSACIKKNSLKEEKCKIEDQLCDTALLLVENRTSDIVFYNNKEMSGTGIGFDGKIKPGETITLKTGYVEVHFNSDCSAYKSMTTIKDISTPSMNFSVKMDRCTKYAHFVKDGANNLQLKVEE